MQHTPTSQSFVNEEPGLQSAQAAPPRPQEAEYWSEKSRQSPDASQHPFGQLCGVQLATHCPAEQMEFVWAVQSRQAAPLRPQTSLGLPTWHTPSA